MMYVIGYFGPRISPNKLAFKFIVRIFNVIMSRLPINLIRGNVEKLFFGKLLNWHQKNDNFTPNFCQK